MHFHTAKLILVFSLIFLLFIYGTSSPPQLRGIPADRQRNIVAVDSSTIVQISYRASAYEEEWRQYRQTVHDSTEVCSVLAQPAHQKRIEMLLRALDAQHDEVQLLQKLGTTNSHLDVLERIGGLLSYMDYKFSNGTTLSVRMEPLVGLLRDPRVSCPEGSRSFWKPEVESLLQAKDTRQWMLLDGRRTLLHKGQRALLLDMGASKWVHGSGSRWISKRLEQQGVTLEHIWAYEARPMPSYEYFEGASVEDMARVHFYNFPVSLQNSPWDMLKLMAKKDDYVIVKLDIDFKDIEIPLAYKLLDDPRLIDIVDEVSHLAWLAWQQ